MTYSLIDIRPVAGAIGAEIHGVDLKKEIPKNQFKEINHRRESSKFYKSFSLYHKN